MAVSKFAGRFPDRLIVVLTKADVVDEGVLKRLRDDGVDMTEHDALEKKVRDLQGQLTKLDQKLGKRKISAIKYEQVLLRRKIFRSNSTKQRTVCTSTGLNSATTLSWGGCSRS